MKRMTRYQENVEKLLGMATWVVVKVRGRARETAVTPRNTRLAKMYFLYLYSQTIRSPLDVLSLVHVTLTCYI